MKKTKKNTSKKSTKKPKKTAKKKIDKKKILEKVKQKKIWIPTVTAAVIILIFLLLYSQKKPIGTQIQRDTYEHTYQHEYEGIPSPPTALAEELKITSYGPTGESRGQVQIKVYFNNPIIPLTTLSDEMRDSIISHFNRKPDIKGKHRILGTSGVVFEP